MWKYVSFLQDNSKIRVEIALASSPKCLVTRHNQNIGEVGQQPETIIQAGPQ